METTHHNTSIIFCRIYCPIPCIVLHLRYSAEYPVQIVLVKLFSLIIFRDTWFSLWSTIILGHLRCLVTTVSIHIEFGDPHIVEQTYWNCHMRASPLGWAKKSKFLIWAFLFAGHLQNGVRDPPKKFQIYRPINDR